MATVLQRRRTIPPDLPGVSTGVGIAASEMMNLNNPLSAYLTTACKPHERAHARDKPLGHGTRAELGAEHRTPIFRASAKRKAQHAALEGAGASARRGRSGRM